MKSIPMLREAPEQDLKKIRGLCFDIDDTFSSRGKITAEAFSSLWNLKKAGYVLVPVTGRPAGWCDHIARFWPVDAVIGENGAFVFYMGKGKRQRLDVLPQVETVQAKKQLDTLKAEIVKQFPHAQWASDQAYREYDLAIDFCEDVSPWPKAEVDSLLSFCHQRKAHAKLSSIHVNTWFGDYDKQSTLKFWLDQGAPGASKKITDMNEWIYIGDSPNDEPAFSFFPKSVGVANLRPYLDRLKKFPTWITEKESGEGFAELAHRLLS